MPVANSAQENASLLIQSALHQSSKGSGHLLHLAVISATQICEVPSAFISLTSNHTEIMIKGVGITAPNISSENPLHLNTRSAPSIFIINSVCTQSGFREHARCFTESPIEFYAGLPLRTSEGTYLGTLAVLDFVPRELTPLQRNQLDSLASQVVAILELLQENLALQSERERLTTELARSNHTNSLLSALGECQESFVRLDYDRQVLNRALKKILHITQFELAVIAVVDDLKLTPLCESSVDESARSEQIEHLLGILSKTVSSKAQYILNQLDPASNALGLRNAIGVPLISHVGVVGVLALANHQQSVDMQALELVTPAITPIGTLLEAYRLRKLQLLTTIRLEELERQHRLIIKGGRIATWDWSLPSDLITWNERWFEICGWTADQLDGSRQSMIEIIHLEDRDNVQDHMQRHLEGNTASYECEYRILAADGSWRWILDQGEIVSRDSNGVPSRLCGVYFDITDRASAINALKAQAERLKQLNLIAAGGLNGFEWQINETLRCVAEMFNCETGLVSILEGSLLTVEHSYNGPSISSQLRRDKLFCELTLESARSLAIADAANSEYSKHPAYTEYNCRSYIGCPLYVTGSLMGTVSFFSKQALQEPFSEVDLDFMNLVGSWISSLYERKMLDVSLVSINSELERSNQELDEFAYVVSHDLKAPLRGIANLAAWIEQDSGDTLPENSKQDLQSLQKRAKRLQKMLEDLLEYAKSGKGHAAAEAIDSREMLEDIVDLMGQSKNFVVSFRGHFPALHLPRAPVEKIFRNLISNAMKHHDRETGTIIIEARPCHNGTCDFFTIDDGPGIQPQYHEHIFKLFSRLKSQDEVEGSGLGLSFVKKTAESLGGTISILSEGRGTTFRLNLPEGEAPLL